MKVINIRTYDEAMKLPMIPFTPEQTAAVEKAVLNVGSSNSSRFSKLKEIYQATDLLVSVESTRSVCDKGCNACCSITVEMTELEARYIEKNAGVKVKANSFLRRPRVGANASSLLVQKTPCSLLSADGACSVYEHRPFPCRVFMAFDSPKYCEEISTHHATLTPQSSAQLQALEWGIDKLNGSGGRGDIREFFS